MSSRQPSRIILYDKDGVVLHDASTPERIAEVNAAWRESELIAEIGDWVTFEGRNGMQVRGQVVDKTEKQGSVEYTLHQFPEHPQGLPIYELGDPYAPYGLSAHGGGYVEVKPE